MTRGIRPLIVWAVVSAATAAAGGTLPAAWRAGASPGADLADLLVAGCATALALSLGWTWLVTTVTVAEILTGAARTGGATRRLVLLACGAAVLAGAGAPAVAADGTRDAAHLLGGLRLPERAVAAVEPDTQPATRQATRSPQRVVVRAGDSLWSIARTHPDATGSVDHRWRAIWAANRDVVGDDPDLIIPGQVLRLPDVHSDGERR
jgi:nucleoid-associated protein YgaU